MVRARGKNTRAQQVDISPPMALRKHPPNPIRRPLHKRVIITTRPGTPMLRTCTPTANGSGTRPALETPTTTSIILGSTGTLRAVLAAATFGGWAAEDVTASGSAVSTSALPPMTTTTATTGYGTVTRS